MRLKNSAKNGIYGVVTLVILALLGFFVTKVLVTNLGIEYNGLNGLFTNIVSILSITELGLGAAISFNLYKPVADNDTEKIKSILLFFRKCYRIIGLTIFTLSLFVTLFIPYIVKDSTLTNNYIRVIFLLFAFNSVISYFFSYRRCLFYANQKEYINTIIDFMMKLTKHILQIVVLIVFKSFVAFLVVNIILTFLNNVFIYVKSKKDYPQINLKNATEDKKLEKRIIGSVKNLAIVQLLNSFISFTDNIIISSIINISTAGLYTNYNLIINELIHVITIVYNGLGASIGNLIVEGKKSRIREIFNNLNYASFFIASFCCCSIYIIMEPFIIVWIGSNYLLSNVCLLIIAINFYLLVMKQPFIYYFKNSGNFKSLILPMGIEAVLNIIISVLLAYYIGLSGVLLGTLISATISYIIMIKRSSKTFDLNCKLCYLNQIKFAIIVAFELIVLKLIYSLIAVNKIWLNVILAGFICFVITNVISLIIVWKEDSIEYLKKIFLNVLERIKSLCKKFVN